jgi:hypothetical protein
MNIGAVMISCPERDSIRAATLASWQKTGMVSEPQVILDTAVCGPGITRRQSRQEIVSKAALQAGEAGRYDYFLFMEDDLEFNVNLAANLNAWEPIVSGMLNMGSLYNPNVAGPEIKCPYANTYTADPSKIYGSQCFVLSKVATQYVLDNWANQIGMQDIKISRICAALGPIYYHAPSLVQHTGIHSVWGGGFHTAKDYSATWLAGS